MDESLPSRPNPPRREQGRDNDILVPRTEIEAGPVPVAEANPPRPAGSGLESAPAPLTRLFTPPVSALGPLFRHRFERIYECRVG